MSNGLTKREPRSIFNVKCDFSCNFQTLYWLVNQKEVEEHSRAKNATTSNCSSFPRCTFLMHAHSVGNLWNVWLKKHISIHSIYYMQWMYLYFFSQESFMVVATFSSYDTKEFVVAGEMERNRSAWGELRRGFLTNKITGS